MDNTVIALAQQMGNLAYAAQTTPEDAARAYTEAVRAFLALDADEAAEMAAGRMNEMIHITVDDNFASGSVECKLFLDEPDGYVEQFASLSRDDLRYYIELHSPCVIWQDDQLVQLCATPGCNELVPVRGHPDRCSGCIVAEMEAHRDSFEPDYAALAQIEPTSQFADSRESAGIPC